MPTVKQGVRMGFNDKMHERRIPTFCASLSVDSLRGKSVCYHLIATQGDPLIDILQVWLRGPSHLASWINIVLHPSYHWHMAPLLEQPRRLLQHHIDGHTSRRRFLADPSLNLW